MTTTRPKVSKKHGRRRLGKGFSLEELKKAKINFKKARNLGIPTDPRRRTAREENIEMLKVLLRNRKTAFKSRKTTRKSKK